MFAEDDLLPISALQHLIYCPRQCALIHLEGLWADNRHTAEGRILHQRAHEPRRSTAPSASPRRPAQHGPPKSSAPSALANPLASDPSPQPPSSDASSSPRLRVARSLPVRSLSLGLFGVCDVVEFPLDAGPGPSGPTHTPPRPPRPIEYKRGRPKAHNADIIQVAAQALCLEEMLGLTAPIPLAQIFYGRTRRRVDVPIDPALRHQVRKAAAGLHALVASRQTPPASYEPGRCDRCSLLHLCQPQALRASLSSSSRFASSLKASLSVSPP